MPATFHQGLVSAIASLRAWLFLIILIIIFEISSRILYDASFILNPYNLQSLAIFAAVPLLLALGQTFVVISAGIDLSSGFIMGLAAVFAAISIRWMDAHGFPMWLSVILGILVSCLVASVPGLINGWLISALSIPPFIGTLGMYGVARGAAYLLADGVTVPVQNPILNFIGNGRIFDIPMVAIIVVGICVIMHYLLSQTKFGQHIYAMGANKAAADRAGINTKWLMLKIYALSGICAGLAGVLYTARFSAGSPQAGEPLLLISIAIVVIGGASLFGGKGTIMGTVAGALVIAVIQYGLVFVNVEPFWQFITVGIIIIISVYVDQAQKKFWGNS